MKNKLIEAFKNLEESELNFLYSMSISANKLMMAADSLPNTMKASLSNSCGHMTADDGTEYQVKIIMVAEKSQWRGPDIIESLSPINNESSAHDLNIDDIN